jgi:AraC-like DNA-binding protein
MRPRNQPARDQLTAVLVRRAPISASSVAEQLGVSIPTLHRLLQEIGSSVVSTGKARRTRYALRKPLRGELAELPLYEVDASGCAELVTSLALVHPQGTCMSLASTAWPVPEESRDGWWDGLPYPLYDMRPQGYMGRQFARAEHRQLRVSVNPEEWTDADVLYVLSRTGSDVSGNLILGNPAYEHWQGNKVAPPEPLKPRALGRLCAPCRASRHHRCGRLQRGRRIPQVLRTARTSRQRHAPCDGEVLWGRWFTRCAALG